MIKKNTLLIFLLLIFFFNGCTQIQNKSSFEHDYKQYKNNFNEKLIDHFPNEMHNSDHLGVSCKTDEEKNNFGLLLYEYGVTSEVIKSIETNLKNKAVSIYTSSDSCLLIVNRFETIETSHDNKIPKILDSGLIDRDCYKNKYPIPNFIDYENYNTASALRLDKGFDLYVLEARPNYNYGHKNLKPDPQMPGAWENGYSKGIAINKEKRVVIYWGIIW